MRSVKIRADFSEFSLPSQTGQRSGVIVPTISGSHWMVYANHAYYFMNLKTSKGLKVTINQINIILPGLRKFLKSNDKHFSLLKGLFKSYHYNFNLLEQMMLLTIPHTVTETGDGCFIISLWGYFGYLEVDCNHKTVTYQISDDPEDDHVFGSKQFYDQETKNKYYMTYSLRDSLQRAANPARKVNCKIIKQNENTGSKAVVWEGPLADYLHDLLINRTRQYLVVCELGMLLDQEKNIIPSKVLVIDLKNKRDWVIEKFIVAAHAQFDPVEPDIIYFSNHNFQFEHSSLFKLLKNANYTVKFRGPAAVYKYRLTPEGPKELGVFSRPDLFRLTNMHVFQSGARRLLAAMGAPNYIFLADANTMEFIRKIEVREEKSVQHLYRNIPCLIGTFAPSPDGEKLYVHTRNSFQVIDVESGRPDLVRSAFFNHSCSNHMMVTSNTNW